MIERQGLFCALYSDRGSHFWHTPKAGGKVDEQRLTVRFQDLTLQIERQSWRGTLAGCNVTVHQHLDGAISLTSVLVWRCGISCMESKTNKHVWRGADDGD